MKIRLTKNKKLLNIYLSIFWLVVYFIGPIALNPMYSGSAWTLLIVITSYVLLNSGSFILEMGKRLNIDANKNAEKDSIKSIIAPAKKRISFLVILWALFIIVNIASSAFFNSKAYRDQFGDFVETEFSDDVQLVDLKQVPVVDKQLAKTLADRKLGEDPGLGSQVFVGEPVIQQINGELIWAVPLHHSGFFMWINNMEGSHGYIKVSATDQNDIELVKKPIKYQPNSYFFDDIDRYVRIMKGKLFDGLTDYSFEIDDEGNAYWIITTYKNEWLLSLPEATGVIILNATTGEIAEYGIDTVPSWVDRVQPESYITTQLNNQGSYVHGVFNFSNKDKFMTSDSSAIVYNEGNCYLFTGLTSVGADESAIGFVMVNMKTKESKFYQISGGTEYAAMLSAQGAVQQFGYSATAPIIINNNGIPTYFITLKDNSGLIKQYAFVSVENVTLVGIGDTINAALRDYNSDLGAVNTFVEEGGAEQSLVAPIVRIGTQADKLGDIFNIILEGAEDTIFYAAQDLSNELSISLIGDTVEITYYDSEKGYVKINSFDNLLFKQK